MNAATPFYPATNRAPASLAQQAIALGYPPKIARAIGPALMVGLLGIWGAWVAPETGWGAVYGLASGLASMFLVYVGALGFTVGVARALFSRNTTILRSALLGAGLAITLMASGLVIVDVVASLLGRMT